MEQRYKGASVRWLREEERLIPTKLPTMPLVIEALEAKDRLNEFLKIHSTSLWEDLAQHGAVLLRGFSVNTDRDFEQAMLSIEGFQGIREAFMSEEGRIHAPDLAYVLETNAVYKTGGTLYFGGFHNENYYTPDVPGYIGFCALKPSLRGGETGLIHMGKIYEGLDPRLQEALENQRFFVSKWLLSDVAKRYHCSENTLESYCLDKGLTIVGEGPDRFILMYKPNVLLHPMTHNKALFTNLFEIKGLNEAMRSCFVADYQGSDWFWHRLVWRLPRWVLKVLEVIYLTIASLGYSPREATQIFLSKCRTRRAFRSQKARLRSKLQRVGSCFKPEDVKQLARLIRENYSSCLWQKGDILLVDNRQVAHTGMPGAGPRLIRAMIANPLQMDYGPSKEGMTDGREGVARTLGEILSGTLTF